MEPKKNPKADVHSIRGVIFNLSLVISLITVICAFQWTVPYETGPVSPPVPDMSELLPDVPVTDYNTPVEKPKPIQLAKPVTVFANPTIEIADAAHATEDLVSVDQEAPGDISQLPSVITIDLEPEDTQTEHRIVEKMPEPVGGLAAFYKDMQKHLKYPRRAIQTHTEGKVFVEFTVERDGQLSNITVLSGIGKGCDEEAIRVISLSKWKAGKQRGKPVRVRMVQPINFKIGQ